MHSCLGAELYAKQDRYCAYCETYIYQIKDGHIEHLERRADKSARTFDWFNMFFSCFHTDSCGKFKDDKKNKITFNPADIVDPSMEDPQEYFIYDANGQIHPVGNSQKERKAKETIRIFNLDQSERLKNLRRKAAITVSDAYTYINTEEEISIFLEELGYCDCLSVYYYLFGRKMV